MMAIAVLIHASGIGTVVGSASPRNWWVAMDGDTVVGCAEVTWHGRSAAILTNCVVVASHRRRGIGAGFVRVRLREARRRRKRIAALCTMYYSFRHYKRFGFRTMPRAKLPESVRTFTQFTSPRYMKCAVMVRALT